MKWINFGCSEFLNQITQVILVLMCVGFRIYHVGNNEQTVPLPASNFSLIVLFNPSGTQCTVPLRDCLLVVCYEPSPNGTVESITLTAVQAESFI